MPPDPSLAALAKLRADPRLAALSTHVPPLRLLDSLGVARDEVAHSRLLATLLDPRTHAGAETMLRVLLARVADNPEASPATTAAIRDLPIKLQPMTIHRELYRVDVIANILPPNGLVVGIENKIDAGEGGQQLTRYQKVLREHFPGRTSVMLFLTPSGRLAGTAAAGHAVPCFAISYADVLAAVEAVQKAAVGLDKHALALVATHLREEIMGQPDDEIRKAVRDLWRDHPGALRLLAEHRPKLEDIETAYMKGIRQALGEVKFDRYPRSRGELSEIKFWMEDWWPTCPFVFMLHEKQGQLFTRVFVWRDDYNSAPKRLAKWAAAVNAKVPDFIDEDFKSLPNWSAWRRVFLEEDWPANALLPVGESDKATAQAAAQRMLELVARLRPYVPKV